MSPSSHPSSHPGLQHHSMLPRFVQTCAKRLSRVSACVSSQRLACSRRHARPARPLQSSDVEAHSSHGTQPWVFAFTPLPQELSFRYVYFCAGHWRSLRSSVASSYPPMHSGGSNRPSTVALSLELLSESQSTSRSGRWGHAGAVSSTSSFRGRETVCRPAHELALHAGPPAAHTHCHPCARSMRLHAV